jgi:hypothetical protein
MMKKTHVKNLAEFVAAVRAFEKQWKIRNRTTPLWFRGHADASWSLLPGLYRGGSMRSSRSSHLSLQKTPPCS